MKKILIALTLVSANAKAQQKLFRIEPFVVKDTATFISISVAQVGDSTATFLYELRSNTRVVLIFISNILNYRK